MKKGIVLIIVISSCMNCFAQNVGINTTAPQAYGHGGTNRVLELKNDAGTGSNFQSHLILSTNGTLGSLGSVTWAAPNIPGAEKRSALISNVFETANATRLAFYTRADAGSLIEKFSINGNGNVGIGTSTPTASLMLTTSINPQLHIRQTNTADYARLRMQTGTSRYWDIAGYNDGTTLANERLNFFNSQAGDILSITGNGNVGIGTTNPITPLGFPATLGRKITLYPGGSGVVGMGVYSNEFRIHTDYEPADITFGYENTAGNFTERFRFKGNGAFAVNGNTGSTGQVLTSNGTSPATWGSPTNTLYNKTVKVDATGYVLIAQGQRADLPGLTYTFSVTGNAKVLVNCNIPALAPSCAFCGISEINIFVNLDGVDKGYYKNLLPNDNSNINSGSALLQVGAGSHTIKLSCSIWGPSVNVSTDASYIYHNEMILQIIPE